jgi:hypothetical protein
LRRQGTVPSSSISREKLRNVRTRTINPSVGAVEGLVDGDRQHDVGDDQDLQPQQDRPADFMPGALVRGQAVTTAQDARG